MMGREAVVSRIMEWAAKPDYPFPWSWHTDFVGQEMSSNYWQYHQVGLILKGSNGLRGICETGTGNASLTMLLGLWAARLGVPCVSFDPDHVSCEPVLPVLERLGVTTPSIDPVSGRGQSAVLEFVRGNTPVYLVCNGENARRHFGLFAPALGPGSIVSVQGWGMRAAPAEMRAAARAAGLVPWYRRKWMERNVQFATWLVPREADRLARERAARERAASGNGSAGHRFRLARETRKSESPARAR